MGFRRDIQGLRAIAVLLVMLFHFNPAWLPGGFVGVDVFLVISGYLIVSILLDKKNEPEYRLLNTLRYFYLSRIKRIAPAYFAMLIVVSLLAAVLFLPSDLAVYKQGLKQAALFNSNHYFSNFGDYFAPANHEQPLLHTWSLAVEIQFYLLAPFFVLLLPLRFLKWLFAALLICLTAVAEYRLRILGIEQATYYSLYARLPEFLAGGLLAMYIHRNGVVGAACFGSLGIVLIMVSAILQPQLGHFPGLPALLPVAGALLLLSQPAQGLVGQLLASKPMIWLGELSYSLYLWHWPVLALLRYYTGSQVLEMPFSLLFITLTLTLSILSYYALETPLRAHRTGIKQMLGYGLLAAVALVTTPSMAKINQMLTPAPLPIEYQRYADAAAICHGHIVGDCLKGDLASDKEVLVLGDSHAAMLNLFFDQLGKELGFKARIITASSCVTIPGFDYKRIAEWAHQACLGQIKEAQKYINKAEIIFIAGMWSWQLEGDNFRDAIEVFLRSAAPQAKKYLLSQIPLLRHNPMRARRFDFMRLDYFAERDESYKVANSILEMIAAAHSNVSYIKLDGLKLFDEAPMHNGLYVYYDDSHINEQGALEYADQAKEIFKPLISKTTMIGSGN